MSLIEVIVSMFMLTVILVFYASALNTVALSRKTRNEGMAYRIASKQIETLRAADFLNLPPSGPIVDPMLSQIPSGSGSFTVSDYPGYTGMKEFVATVGWNDGQARSVVIRSLAGTGGINP